MMKRYFFASFIAVLTTLLVVAAVPPASAEKIVLEHERGPGKFLIGYTLIFPDELGREHLIHFSRFGTFDWYFPCQFETGSWDFQPDGVLQLTYDNTDFSPRALKLERGDDEVTLSDPARESITLAQLVEGNRLPFG